MGKVIAKEIGALMAASAPKLARGPAVLTRGRYAKRRFPERAPCTLVFSPDPNKEISMNSDRTQGAVDQAKGAIKQGAGKLTGDAKLKAEGTLDKAKGKVESAVGKAEDDAEGAADD